MYTEDFGGYNSGNREAIKDIDKRLPRLDITAPFAFVVKAVNFSASADTQ